jgi:MFS family permease
MVSRVGIGRIVERVGRLRLITISAAGAAIAMVGVAIVHDPLVLAGLSIAVGLGLGFGQPLSMTIVVRLVPDSARATALAIRLTGNRIGQVAAPATAALIAGRTGPAGVFGVMAAALAVSAVTIQRPALRRADGDEAEVDQAAVAEPLGEA